LGVRGGQRPQELQVGALVELAEPLQRQLADPLRAELAARGFDRQLDSGHNASTSSAVTWRLWVERSNAARNLARSKRWRSPSRLRTKTGSRSPRS